MSKRELQKKKDHVSGITQINESLGGERVHKEKQPSKIQRREEHQAGCYEKKMPALEYKS